MGLDAHACRHLRWIGEEADLSEDRRGELEHVYDHPDFPGRHAPLKPGYHEAGETLDAFRGGYMGYGRWREWLAELAGYPAEPVTRLGEIEILHTAGAAVAGGGPFWEMIYFSDCEGVLGTDACAKLAGDFAAFREAARKADVADRVREDSYFTVYDRWQRAFEFASQGGCVVFS